MPLATVTHLNFRGQARAALGFYHSVFGASLVILTYADVHSVQDPAEADQIMWGQVAADDGFRIMAFDVPSSRPWLPGENAFYVSVSSPQVEEIRIRWERLQAGGEVLEPLAPALWAPRYGKLRDRFGTTWLLAVNAPHRWGRGPPNHIWTSRPS